MTDNKEQKFMWYTIRTQTNYERKAIQELNEKVLSKYKDEVNELFLPTENVVVVKNGKKTVVEKIYYPGYLFIEAKMSNQLLIDIKNCTKNQGLMMTGDKPSIVPPRDINKMKEHAKSTELDPTEKSKFNSGNVVTIKDGPFAGFVGNVSVVNSEKEIVTVLVSVFGRETPVDLSFSQVELNS